MKNLFNKILIIITIAYIIFLVIFAILGNKNRLGYLTDFKLNIDRTLELNNLMNITENSIIDEESLSNYLLTNENIKNYIYHFRIRYYDKVFRNNDIYGVYPDLSNLPNYMENAEMEDGGSPYGNCVSDKYLQYDDKIEVSYKLSLKFRLYMILAIFIIILIRLSRVDKLNNILNKYIYIPKNEFEYKQENIFKIKNPYYVIFILSFIFLILFIIFYGYITPIFGDDYIFATNYEIYNIYKFNGKFFERGRHIADMFILLNMKPFGMFLMNFGVEPFWALKISQTILYTAYFFFAFFSVSYFTFIINGKQNFKMIFLVVSPMIFYLFMKCEVASFYVRVAAYVATVGSSILAWIPLVYYFIFDEEMPFFIQNNILAISLWLPIMYFVTFIQEPSVWTLAGLTVFFIIYMIIKLKFPNFLYDNHAENLNSKIPLSIILLTIIHLSFTVIAFILTMKSIRGKSQLSVEFGFQNFKLMPRSSYIEFILIIGIILLIYLFYNLVKNRKINKLQYIQTSLILTGFIGILSFLYIRVYYGITLCLIFIFISILLELLKWYKNKKLISSIMLVFLAVILYFELFLMYSSKAYNIKAKPDIIIHDLFVEAERLGKKEIVITRDIDKYENIKNYIPTNFEIYNSYLSEFMQMYGITKDFIPIYRVDNKSQLSNTLNQTNRVNYR